MSGHSHSGAADSATRVTPAATTPAGQRWLLGALTVLVVFMCGEIVTGVLAHSLALISDAGHLLTDAAALLAALIAIRIARRPPTGRYTYGFARIDALAGQANGLTLLILAALITVGAGEHLVHPPPANGAAITIVAAIGVVMNVVATSLARRADRVRLSVRGAVSHLINDGWAFLGTAAAGLVIIFTNWTRADAVASLGIAVLMTITGIGLVRASGRIFLEAAREGLNADELGDELAEVDGVVQVHDLHVWQLGPGEDAMSAHVLVWANLDCHDVAAHLRRVLIGEYGLRHVTLQVDHAGTDPAAPSVLEHCAEPHGRVHRPTRSMVDVDPPVDAHHSAH